MGKLHDLLRFVLPDICSCCGDETHLTPGLCDPCVQTISRNVVSCRYCANPLPNPGVCPACLIASPGFDVTIGPFLYDDTARALVSSAKFHRDLGALACMGHLLGRHIASVVDKLPDVVIPVPLHVSRLRQRGYNQAIEMTKVIRRYVPISIDTRSCTRIVPTAAQSGLQTLSHRRRNVRHAFAIGKMPAEVDHVALVDDVMTTGSTLGEITRCLLQAGVQRVDVWVFARAFSGK